MNLVLFDLDGTLTDTTGVDDACFVQAMREVLGVRGFPTDWSKYAEATDEGLTDEICRRAPSDGGLGRSPTEEEVCRIRARFIELLARSAAEEPGRFRAVAGAPDLVSRIGEEEAVGIATGAWRESAMIKLRAAGLAGLAGIPAAFADRGLAERARIVSAAAARAAARAGVRAFDATVYVGDGPWDVRAARGLGMGFVGVGTGQKRERLLAAGAPVVLPDFADLDEAVAVISRAAVAR